LSFVVFRPGRAGDRHALEGLLSGLSPDSAYARFQTALGPDPSPAVVDALLPDGVRGGSLLGWDAHRLVAHGLWVRLGLSRAAEVAVVVTDSHQRRGIGTDLAQRLITAAGVHGIERIEVFSEAQNRAVSRMVSRRAPDAAHERDGATVSYSFPIDRHAGSAWTPVAWEVERREAWSA
jgi:GNAT superfamily N-acetyltransferase